MIADRLRKARLMKKVTCCPLQEPIEITKALLSLAPHKGCNAYDLMREAADSIRELESCIDFLYEDVNKREHVINILKEEIKLAIPAMRKFAEIEYYGKAKDPFCVHEWLKTNDPEWT